MKGRIPEDRAVCENSDIEEKFEELIRAALLEEDTERWEEALREEEEAPEGEFAETIEEENAHIARIRKAGKEARKKEKRKKYRALRYIGAAAAVLVLAVTIQAVSTKQAEASKATVTEVVMNCFQEFIEIKNQSSEYMAIKYDIKEPEYIPEGYELVKKYEGKTRCERVYQNLIEDILVISYTTVKEGYSVWIDKEDREIYNTKVLDYDALFFVAVSDLKGQTLYWNDGIINYKIDANLPWDEMRRIGEGMVRDK